MATDSKKKVAPSSPHPTDPVADAILRAIRRILRKTAEHSRQLKREGDLSMPQLLCLKAIENATAAHPVTGVDVARAVQLSNPTVSRILDRLAADELIVRTRSDVDRRKVYLTLSTAGRRRIRRVSPPLQQAFLERLRELPATQRKQLLASLETIVAMMGAESLDAAPMLMPGSDAKSAGDPRS